MYLLELPRRGDSNKYTKRMIYKKKSVQKYPLRGFSVLLLLNILSTKIQSHLTRTKDKQSVNQQFV